MRTMVSLNLFKGKIKDVSIVRLVKDSYMVVHVNTSQIQELEIKRPTQQ